MNALEIIAQDLFDKVRSRFSNLQMGGEAGAVTVMPQEARFFDFDFVVEGNNLGRVSISINDTGSLKVYYSQGIVEGKDSITQGYWFDFLREMRQFAKRRMLRFDTRDITKGNLDKNDFAYLAQQQAATQQPAPQDPAMTESTMYGSSKSSYRPLEKTLLIVRHNRKVGEDRGARSRSNNINSIFIQNEAGERFKYPFVHLAGAKAMQRHVANGGTPFDNAGQTIIGMSEQISQLSSFRRHVGNIEQLTNEARGIVDKVGQKLDTLRNTLESISKQTKYEQWRESLEETALELSDIDEATIEDYKSKFTVSSFKEDLTQYFPLLYKVMQETSTVDLEEYVGEAKDDYCDACDRPIKKCVCDDETKESIQDAFEEWADEIVEGPKRSDVPAYLRKAKGEKPLTPKDIEDEQSAGKISHPDTLRKNRGVKEAGYNLEPTSYQDWKASIERRLSKGEIKDPAEIAAEIGMYFPKFSDETAMKVAKSMFMSAGGTDPMAQHRIKPSDELDVPKDGGEDDDDSFLARLRSQARSGSIKQDTTGFGAEKESAEMGAEQDPESPIKAIAEKVLSHFDRINGTFPLGATAIGVQVSKEHGPQAGKLAEKLCDYLQSQHESSKQMEAIRRLSGLAAISEAEKKTMSRAAKGVMKYGKDGMKALAKAGKEGKSLDKIRDKYNKYD